MAGDPLAGKAPEGVEKGKQMIEYRVRPVTRWAITKYERDGVRASLATVCEVPNLAASQALGEALAAKDGGVFFSYGPDDLGDIVLLLRRIAGQIEDGTIAADLGILTLRAKGQKRPLVYGLGKVIKDPEGEMDRAKEELVRLAGNQPK